MPREANKRQKKEKTKDALNSRAKEDLIDISDSSVSYTELELNDQPIYKQNRGKAIKTPIATAQDEKKTRQMRNLAELSQLQSQQPTVINLMNLPSKSAPPKTNNRA